MPSEPTTPTVARIIVQRVLAGFAALGIDVPPVLARCGLDEQEVANLPERVPSLLVRDLFVAARELTGDRSIGVRLAELVEPEFYEVFGYVVKSSPTLGEALARTERYLRLLGDGFVFSVHAEGSRALLHLQRTSAFEPAPETVELLVGSVAVIARRVSGHDFSPLEVRFAHDPPSDLSHHARVFRAPVVFRSAHDGLVFSPAALALPSQTSDPRLCRLLERQADQLLAALPEVGRYGRRVREAIAKELAAGTATATRIAKRLAMHPRTLSRRLRAEGTSLRQLLDAVRRELAGRYLVGSPLSVAEIAERLGFSDATAFNKAFRRWMGDSPQGFRRRSRAGGTSPAA